MRSINEISPEKNSRPWERGVCSLYTLSGEDDRGGVGGGRIGPGYALNNPSMNTGAYRRAGSPSPIPKPVPPPSSATASASQINTLLLLAVIVLAAKVLL